MNKILKNSFGILIIFIPLIVLLGLLFNNIAKRSFYPAIGDITVSGLKSPVRTYFDDFGVPHIIAQNEEDAYFSLGYMHARDRLWQMDLTRRVAEGRLSEIFGTGALDFDRFFKTIGINRFCYYWYDSISTKSKLILDSYTKGVNKFIEANYDNLPVEFDALNYRPDPWKPEQSLMIIRLMGWDLNIAWYTDYVLGEIVNKVGIEKTSAMFPDTNFTLFKKPVIEEDSLNSEKEKASIESLKQIAVLGKDFFSINESFRNAFNTGGSHTGSNSWVVSGTHSQSGKPMHANDPHLGLQAPSKWYEIYIKGGGLEVRGMTIAGVPGVAIGSSKYISWGLTNLMNDDNDFVILNKDSADEKKYFYNKQAYSLDSIRDKIYVKDSAESDFTIYITKAGPVISNLGMRGFADLKQKQTNIFENKLLTFLWTGFELSDEIACFYKINTAKSWEEFKNGLKDFNVPALNFTYADINGNIGYHAAGKIPVRKTGDMKNYLYPNAADLVWTGFIDFEKLPNTFNPEKGFIITANTNPFDWLNTGPGDRYYISYLWEMTSRFDKINEYLSSRAVLDIDDFKLLQNSLESPYARTISKYIPLAFKDQNLPDENIKWCIERFAGWNGELNPDESIGLVYNTFLVFLLKNTYSDELGSELLHDFFVIQNLPYRSIRILLNDSASVWFDNVNTANLETRDEIIRLSLFNAIDYLKSKFENQDINTWHWGVMHKVKFRHPFGLEEAMDKAFNIGPFNIGGDQTTPNNTEYQFNNFIEKEDFSTIVGVTMRMIVDMSDPMRSFTINSTGQSGQPVHINYRDQSRMWLYGEYKTGTAAEFDMLHKNYSLLTLHP